MLTVQEQRELRRSLPAHIATFITEFQNNLSEDVRSDGRFAYRLLLLPMKGPKTEADMALNFVRQDDLSDDDLKALLGQQGSAIVAEKYRESVHGDEMLPKAASLAVESRIPFTFGVNDFTALRKAWQVGPAKTGSKTQLPKSDSYCAYSPAFSQFVYRPKLVDRMAEAVETADKYEQMLGKVPKLKPTR